jgi:ABC-type uncharacterized transport system substrate-binding protein
MALLFALVVLSGCSVPSLRPDPVPEPEPEIVLEPPLAGVSVTPLERVPLPPELPPVAIVLTNGQPAYADVVAELTRHFARYEIYDLSQAGRPPLSILRSINDSGSSAVIAIGSRAAQSAVAMSDKPVVFSQGFNYAAQGLLVERSRGVSALAPLDAQLAAWKGIDPALARVGLIIGEGHDDLIADARVAAERQGIDLRVQVTRSDQETLYFFRRMIRDIDGFWLLPDNRVLSPRALQEMLGEARRQQVPVNVPSESMLQLGAMVSMSTVAADIATTIADIVRQIQAGDLAGVPPITQLSEIRVVTNDTTQVVER